MADLQSAKVALLKLKTAVEGELETGKDLAKPVSLETSIGRLSRMDALQGQQMALEGQARRRQRLQRIESALLRIEHGSYGLCVRCQESISEPRLQAQPEVLLCLNCASEPGR